MCSEPSAPGIAGTVREAPEVATSVSKRTADLLAAQVATPTAATDLPETVQPQYRWRLPAGLSEAELLAGYGASLRREIAELRQAVAEIGKRVARPARARRAS